MRELHRRIRILEEENAIFKKARRIFASNENCGFHALKTEWALDHCFGHQPGIIEALVGLQSLALSLWRWWLYHHRPSATSRTVPLVQRTEQAFVACLRMWTAWLAWWVP